MEREDFPVTPVPLLRVLVGDGTGTSVIVNPAAPDMAGPAWTDNVDTRRDVWSYLFRPCFADLSITDLKNGKRTAVLHCLRMCWSCPADAVGQPQLILSRRVCVTPRLQGAQLGTVQVDEFHCAHKREQ